MTPSSDSESVPGSDADAGTGPGAEAGPGFGFGDASDRGDGTGAGRCVLHVLTRPPDALISEQIRLSRGGSEARFRLIDLTRPNPSYEGLLNAILESETIVVW